MALSNWATLAVSVEKDYTSGKTKTKLSEGMWTSPLGVGVEIYKNWVHIHDKKAWVSGGDYVKPIVIALNEGELTYKDVHLVAVRGSQYGIYVAVWTKIWHKKSFNDESITGMVGCGVNGYTANSRWVGLTKKAMKFFAEFLKKQSFSDSYPLPNELGDNEEIQGILKTKGTCYNQGSAYMMKALKKMKRKKK